MTTKLDQAPRHVPRWWHRVLPILVALNAFALGVQYAAIVNTRTVLEAAQAAQTEVDANLVRARELLTRASAPTCQRFEREQSDASQVSSL